LEDVSLKPPARAGLFFTAAASSSRNVVNGDIPGCRVAVRAPSLRNVELAVIDQREFELPADSADVGLRKE
jgi:hypothetical protein